MRNISRKSPLIGLWRLGAPSVAACTEAAAGGRELGLQRPSRGRVHLVTSASDAFIGQQRPPCEARSASVSDGQHSGYRSHVHHHIIIPGRISTSRKIQVTVFWRMCLMNLINQNFREDVIPKFRVSPNDQKMASPWSTKFLALCSALLLGG